MSAEIFRKVALERLSTPDQLDQALSLSPVGYRLALWLALLAVVLILLASFFVTVPVLTSGVGIVMPAAGMDEVVAQHAGQVRQVLVQPGSRVRAGQVVAQLDQPELEQALQALRLERQDWLLRRKQILQMHAQAKMLQERQHSQRAAELRQRLHEVGRRIGELSALAELTGGAQETWERITQMRERQAEWQQRLQMLESESLQLAQAQAKEAAELEQRLAGMLYRQQQLEQKLARESQLRVLVAGEIGEIKIASGDVLLAGQAVASLVPMQASAAEVNIHQASGQVIAYLPASEAKKVKAGMPVRVIPGNVKREEFGAILGTVLSVAALPASPEGMQKTLRNRQLVQTMLQTLAQNSAPIEVRIQLCRDPQTTSGWCWTSRGPDLALETGTLVAAEVVVKRMRLLALALPTLESWLQLEQKPAQKSTQNSPQNPTQNSPQKAAQHSALPGSAA